MRLTSALGASLALHLVIGLIPPGHISFETKPGSAKIAGSAAPLWVTLGQDSQVPVRLARNSLPTGSPSLSSRQQTASASALANTEEVPLVVNSRGESPTTEATGGKPGLPEPYYLPPGELSEPARLLSGVEGIPAELARDVDSGRMIVMLFINELGTIDKLVVENTELRNDMGAVLAEQFQHARYSPAIKDNQPVKSRMRVEITLQPPGPFMPPTKTSATGN
jgi:hypothetical protein